MTRERREMWARVGPYILFAIGQMLLYGYLLSGPR